VKNLLLNHREITVGELIYKVLTLPLKMHFLMIFILCLCNTDGANILGIFPMPAKSHMTVYSALLKELARRGHQVTVFSQFPEKSPIQNFTDVEFKLSYPELIRKSGEHNVWI
jgi:glucuronosyltransferase